MHHKDAVNQNLRAGQRVKVNERAFDEKAHGKDGEFVKYTDVYVCIDGKEHWTSLASLITGGKDPQRLKRGDEIRIEENRGKTVIRGKSGKFDRYADTRVQLDCGGKPRRFVVTSLVLV